MMLRLYIIYICTFLCVALSAQERVVSLRILETSDLHGHFYPYNFLYQRDTPGSLSRVASLIKERRHVYGRNLILLDNGDIIQGQPTVYYPNFIDTVSPHLCAQMMNYLRYDAGNMGNHDIEAGRRVFERWIGDCNFPMLGANIIDNSTGEPYFKPYMTFDRQGVRIVVLGLITPAIPAWVPKQLWAGLHFEDMEKAARKWMKIIRKRENPDVVVGLFHAGQFPAWVNGSYRDNASVDVAERVSGFDVVLIGHDHVVSSRRIVNRSGDEVLVLNPGCDGKAVAEVELNLTFNGTDLIRKKINGVVTSANNFEPDSAFLAEFKPQYEELRNYLATPIGTFTNTLSTRDAYFGPSAFVDFIHYIQLQETGADISFTAPLAFDAQIKAGAITVNDMFTLYKFENLLYTMRLSGHEIKNYLEASYADWTDRMKRPDDHLLLLSKEKDPNRRFNALRNYCYNFDSAAGIRYEVDVTQKKGKKIRILSMADGSAFDPDKEYKVVINSYRANGGGGLITRGAGISQYQLEDRIVASTEKDIRYYLIKYISEHKTLDPRPMNQWKFVPEDWAHEAAKRDYEILFPQAKTTNP